MKIYNVVLLLISVFALGMSVFLTVFSDPTFSMPFQEETQAPRFEPGLAMNFCDDGGLATRAQLDYPNGLVFDREGNLFIADTNHQRVRKIDINGIITTAAGNGLPGIGDDSVSALGSRVATPTSVAMDSAGNLFIADGGYRIRKVDAAGIITTVAGNGTKGFSGDGGPATEAQLDYVGQISIDSAGNLFIADVLYHRIRKVDADGIITTVAGNGTEGFSGDRGPAVDAQLAYAFGIAIDSKNNLLIADAGNNRIRKVDTAGIITTVAGDGTEGFSGDGGPATDASFSGPFSITIDDLGNLFIVDLNNNRIRKIDISGIITTVAGNGTEGFSGDGGLAISAQLSYPNGLAVDNMGNLFVADASNNRIRKIDSDGIITTIAGPSYLTTPTNNAYRSGMVTLVHERDIPDGSYRAFAKYQHIAFDNSDNLFVSDRFDSQVYKIDQTGTVTVVVGNGVEGFSGDSGLAAAAQLVQPEGIAFDNMGNLYIADASNHRIRRVDTSGIITTIAGNGEAGTVGDGVLATESELSYPSDITFDNNGNLFFIDSSGIHKIDNEGIVTHVSDDFEFASSGIAEGEEFSVSSIAFDNESTLHFVDSRVVDRRDENIYYVAHRVFRVNKDNTVTLVAGNGTTGHCGDGGLATQAQLSANDITFDSEDNLWIADSRNQRVRMVDTAGTISTVVAKDSNNFLLKSGDETDNISYFFPDNVAFDNNGNLFAAEKFSVFKLDFEDSE